MCYRIAFLWQMQALCKIISGAIPQFALNKIDMEEIKHGKL